MAHNEEGPHVIPGGDGPKWVKVEFYGLLPPGRSVVDVNPDEMSRFGLSLGFTHLGAVTAVLAEPPEPKLAERL
jgi:hypothetical protein